MAIIKGPQCHTKGITGEGPDDAEVVIVGLSPGQDEIRQGRPFVGPTGHLLNALLVAAGWSREKTYCTNLMCWHTNDPTPEEVLECLPRVIREIKERKPKLVITMGRQAATLVGSTKPLGAIRGSVMWSTQFDCWILPTFHPATILHGGVQFVHDIFRDLRKIALVKDWPKDHADVRYEVVRTREEAQEVLNALPHEYVAVDVETSSASSDEIDVYTDQLLCVAIALPEQAWVFTPEALKGVVWPTGPKWVFHNGIFDTQVIFSHFGQWLEMSEDTMLMSYSIDERSGQHSLKTLSREYCASGFYEEGLKEYRKKSFSSVPPEVLYEYNAKDAAYTARLVPILLKLQEVENVRGMYQDILLASANAFKEIEYRGVYIDDKEIKRLALEWFPRYLETEEALVREATSLGFEKPINLNSPKQLSHLLYDILQLPGGPSTAKTVLDALRNEHPFVDHLLDFRHLDHMIGTYILGISDDIKRDARIHADVMLHGTVTGRLAYRKPPLQTIPKSMIVGDDYGRIRRIFKATNDNYLILEVDYRQVELWVAAALSGDKVMLSDLQSGDFHTRSATSIFRCDPSEVTPFQRNRSKFVTFGIMYGRGPASLAQGELKCSIAEAEAYQSRWFGRYPEYSAWRERQRDIAVQQQELVSITGRKRRFRLVMGEEYKALNQAVNFPIQSAASDLTLINLVALHRRLRPLDSYVLFAVHDSILFEVNKQHRDEAVQIIEETMCTPRWGLPGIPVEMKEGDRWGLMDA